MKNGRNQGNLTFHLNPVPKPQYERRSPKRGEQGKFSPRIRQEILERDQALCIRCNKPAHHIHHIVYRSHLGPGSKRNGVCVCFSCHEWAHLEREGRRWFERWREIHLDENGDLKEIRDIDMSK